MQRYSSAPAAIPSSIASCPARADSITTGTPAVRWSMRSSESRPNPSSTGIITSVRTRSGGSSSAARSAASPLATVRTANSGSRTSAT